jgi:hypothetical protein
MEFWEKLVAIQNDLKAPKDKENKFGGFRYRSCEGILEAVKPLLAREGLVLSISDEIVEVTGRVYVKATATITDGTNSQKVTAYAREADTKKGMDPSQATGASSSYARKYALNGLFCIDDAKDADTDEYHNQQEKAPKQQPKPSQSQPAKQSQQAQSQFKEYNAETELVGEQEMLSCNSYVELMAVWNRYHAINPQYCRKDGPLSRAFIQRNNEINANK